MIQSIKIEMAISRFEWNQDNIHNQLNWSIIYVILGNIVDDY